MKISQMIQELQSLNDRYGDLELLVTDGYEAICYRGDYAVALWKDLDGTAYADIGIGGCREE